MKRTRKLPVMTDEEIERFWAKVNKIPNGCWEWTGAMSSNGYGAFHLRGKTETAHKIAFFLSTGKAVKSGNCIMHSCDNKGCTKPDHLSEGTTKQNIADAVARGLKVDVRCAKGAHFVSSDKVCKVCK